MTPRGIEPAAALTYDDLAKLPLRDRAHFWMYGHLPDGRRVWTNWARPDESIMKYVAQLEARLAGKLAVDEHADALRKLADS